MYLLLIWNIFEEISQKLRLGYLKNKEHDANLCKIFFDSKF